VVSKLRQKLGTLGLDRDRVIANAFRCYQFRPPTETWIDLEAAANAVHQAEGALAGNQPQVAYGPTLIAATIARRPFLAGEDSPWIDSRRQRQRELLVRALDCRVEALLSNGEVVLALDQARAAVAARRRHRSRPGRGYPSSAPPRPGDPTDRGSRSATAPHRDGTRRRSGELPHRAASRSLR